MNLSSDLQAKIENYLNAVNAQLGDKSEAARRELLTQLREHIAEAVRHRSATPTAADVEAVLAEMDPPESFAEESDQPSAIGYQPSAICNPQSAINNSSRWFVIALTALALNASPGV